MIIPHDQFGTVVLHEYVCVRVCVCDAVTLSVAVVSGIYMATTDDCRLNCNTYTRRMHN